MKKESWLRFGGIILILSFALTSPLGAQTKPSGKPILLGVVDSYTGAIALQAADSKMGIETAIEDINSSGGILGRPIVAYYRDAKLKPEISAEQTRRLIHEDKVDFLFAVAPTTVVKPASEEAKKEKKLLFTAATSAFLTEKEGHRYIFRFSPNSRSWAGVPSIYMSKNFPNLKKWITLCPDVAFGRELVGFFKDALKKRMPDVVFVDAIFTPLGEADFSPYISAMLGKDADAIFSNVWASDQVSLIRQALPMGLFKKFKFVTYQSMDVRRPLGKEMPEGIVVWDYFEVSSPPFKSIVDKFVTKTKVYPGGMTLLPYYSLMYLKAAAEKAGSIDTERVIDAMKGLTLDTPWGPVTMRKYDNQADLGAVVGITKHVPAYEFAILDKLEYVSGKELLMPEEEIRKMRGE